MNFNGAILTFLVLLITSTAHAEVVRLEIPPALTGDGIVQATSPHLALRNPDVPSSGFLLISIGGTNSNTDGFRHVHQVALSLGHAVLAIDYPNHVISTTCREGQGPTCYDQFRAEVALGIGGSNITEVNAQNSILNRIQSLLRLLVDRDPATWSRFARNDGVDWSKVILIGHSQGSGHAAYLSKFLPLKRLILFAGPQDAFANGEVAAWTKLAGQTSPAKIFAFLHADDFFDARLQMKVNSSLHGNSKMPVIQVREGQPTRAAFVLLSQRPAADGHNAVLQPENADVFRLLLTVESD